MAGEKLRPIDRILEVLYSLAAVPVLLGALFKITHKSPIGNPNTWLEVGLYTEAFVFLTFAIRYAFFPPKKVDELGNSADDANGSKVIIAGSGVGTITSGGYAGTPPATAASGSGAAYVPQGQMDRLFQNTDITPESIQKLSDGFKSLENTLNKLGTASGSIVDTEEYAQKMKEATASLNNLNTFYGKLSEASAAIADSAEDAQKTQKEMSALAANLAKLNQIYGSMITAMQGKTIN